MEQRKTNREERDAGAEERASGAVAARAPYAAPHLERLGPWSALTLQQSIPIFP